MRVVTLNVNGIRSAAKKGLYRWLAAQKADVVCLQEIKAHDGDLAAAIRAPRGLHGFFSHAEKKGYAGVALYSRVLEPREVAENYARYRDLYRGRERDGVPRLVVRAVLEETSAVPSLREISPYRVALAAYAWRVDEVLSGEGAAPGDRLRVAHWVLLDAERTPAAALRPGAERRLVLEPFSANPQLEPHVLSETLAGPPDGPLWFAAGE